MKQIIKYIKVFFGGHDEDDVDDFECYGANCPYRSGLGCEKGPSCPYT